MINKMPETFVRDRIQMREMRSNVYVYYNYVMFSNIWLQWGSGTRTEHSPQTEDAVNVSIMEGKQ